MDIHDIKFLSEMCKLANAMQFNVIWVKVYVCQRHLHLHTHALTQAQKMLIPATSPKTIQDQSTLSISMVDIVLHRYFPQKL